jgi:2-methylcitrate dehydratase PrpD
MQGPIDAVLSLRRTHALTPEAVARVEVGVLAAAAPIVCEPAEVKRHPASVVDAQFSLPFGVAVALVRGCASADDFVPAALEDATIRALMERVSDVRDPTLDAVYPRIWPSWVRIHLRDGRTLEARVDHPHGDPENFLDDAELDAKFRRLASRTLPADAVDRLGAALAAFPDATAPHALMAATVPCGR